jgi:hypothetical protein
MQTSRLNCYCWVGMNLVLVAFLGRNESLFWLPKRERERYIYIYIYIYSFLVFCSLYLVVVLAFINEELYCLWSLYVVGLHGCVPQKWLSFYYSHVLWVWCTYFVTSKFVYACIIDHGLEYMGFIFCMLVTIGLLVLRCLLNYPFGVVVIGWLGGQIPNGSPCFKVPTYTFVH